MLREAHRPSAPNGLELVEGHGLRLHPRIAISALYVGCSTDYEVRFHDHEAGTACRTSALDPPLAVRLIEIHPDLVTARRRESQLKKWSRAKKEALIAQDFTRLHNLSRSHD